MGGASDRTATIALSTPMTVARSTFPLFLVIGLGCCSSSLPQRTTESRMLTPTGHCDIAIAALHAVVRPAREERFGLDRACVEKSATLGRKIYVDARFWHQERLEEVAAPTCEREGYVIRFDWKNFEPSPAEVGVVVLSLWYRDPALWEFTAAVKDRMWPRDLPEMEERGLCRVAWGAVSRGPSDWQGLVIQPASHDRQ
jgi:hypothetical protein